MEIKYIGLNLLVGKPILSKNKIKNIENVLSVISLKTRKRKNRKTKKGVSSWLVYVVATFCWETMKSSTKTQRFICFEQFCFFLTHEYKSMNWTSKLERPLLVKTKTKKIEKISFCICLKTKKWKSNSTKPGVSSRLVCCGKFLLRDNEKQYKNSAFYLIRAVLFLFDACWQQKFTFTHHFAESKWI